METKEILHLRAAQSMEHLFDKIDRICDDARDNNHMGDGEVTTMLEAWKAIHCIIASTAAKGVAI